MFHDLVERTEFAEKADCLKTLFARRGLDVYPAWQNAPTLLGTRVCGLDVFSVVAALNEAYAEAEREGESVPELEEEPEPEEEVGGPKEAGDPEDDASVFSLVEKGLSERHAQTLASAGYMTIGQMLESDREELTEALESLEGIGEATAGKIINLLGSY